jgi:3-hydroxyacyl-CoA dehydrogenase / 3-hydroxy-2-methylbutyryl-CoA dehydrogenase
MTLPVARELGALGIRCNTIAPGIFGTPMVLAMPDKLKASLSAQVPFPSRPGHPHEFAALCCQIVENPYLNGTVLSIDGSIRMAAL